MTPSRALRAPSVLERIAGLSSVTAFALAALVGGTSCKRPVALADAGVDAAASDEDAGDDDGGVDAASDADAGELEVRLPPAASDELTARGRHLLEAIVQGNPELAGDILLARDAYQKMSGESDPAKTYDRRIAPAFVRAIGRLHQRSKGLDGAQFVSFEIGGSITQSSAPSTSAAAAARHREWKRPVWRAHHAKLVFTVSGKLQRFDVGELVAWRGSWYVLHLH